MGRMYNKVWRGEGWPEEWKTGLVVPFINKGDGKKVKENRGIKVMSTDYKICMKILRKRLEGQIEENESIPQNQAGFRKGIFTMHSIYVLKHGSETRYGRGETRPCKCGESRRQLKITQKSMRVKPALGGEKHVHVNVGESRSQLKIPQKTVDLAVQKSHSSL